MHESLSAELCIFLTFILIFSMFYHGNGHTSSFLAVKSPWDNRVHSHLLSLWAWHNIWITD